MKALTMSSTSRIPPNDFKVPLSNNPIDIMTALGVVLIAIGIILLAIVVVSYFAKGIQKNRKLAPIEKIFLATGSLVTFIGIVLAIL